MCLAVPGRILHINGRTATVDFGGIKRQVLIDLMPDLKIGEYVLVHAGFAIQRLETEAAEELLAGFAEALGGPAAGPAPDRGDDGEDLS